jgi:hypothetical protein
VHDALRLARGAAGVEQEERVARAHGSGCRQRSSTAVRNRHCLSLMGKQIDNAAEGPRQRTGGRPGLGAIRWR